MNKKIPILIDFDGVIRIGKKPAPGAGNFLKFISEKNIPSFIISNSTFKTGKDITVYLKEYEMNFGIPAMTSVDAAFNYVKDHYKRISIFCKENIKENFRNFINDENPEAVLMGDLGNKWTYEIMNDIFRKVHNGADLIAMQKNKFWKPDGINLSLDAGPYIKAIEYAAGKKSILIGKPSPIYFKSAVEMAGFSKDSPFIMVGDDLETDIQAAQKIGGTGILIYTGKTKYPLDPNLLERPNYEVKYLTEAITLLENILNKN